MISRFKKQYCCHLCEKKFYSYKSSPKKFCCLSHSYTYRLKEGYLAVRQHVRDLEQTDFFKWFVGFWEGEGYIQCDYQDRKYTFMVAQKDTEIFKEIRYLLRMGRITNPTPRNVCSTYILCEAGKILALCESMYPYIRLDKRKREVRKFLNCRRAKELKFYV